MYQAAQNRYNTLANPPLRKQRPAAARCFAGAVA